MDIDRKQRTDIDTVTNDRLTLSIDESNIEDNPYVHETIKGMDKGSATAARHLSGTALPSQEIFHLFPR